MDMHTAHDIWQTLVRASVDRRHPWRAVGLSTQGADGPQSRHVILRKAHPDARQLVFYTDARSGKMTELALCERVALLMWNPQQRQQLRLWGTARAESDPATIERHWAAVPDQARRDYASLQAPGAVLHTPSPDHGAPCDLQAARNHFTVLRVQIERLDLLVLNRDRHVRSGHRWEAGAGCWQTDERVP